MKGVAVWVAFVLAVAISLAGIIIGLQFIYPAFKKFKEASIINEGIENIEEINLQIERLVKEGGGSRKIPISISGGEYLIDGEKDSIKFFIKSEARFIEPGVFMELNGLRVSSGSGARAWENVTHLILENSVLRIAFNKLNDSFFGIFDEIFLKEAGVVIKPKNSSLIFNLDSSLSITPVTSSLVKRGEKLSQGEAIFNSSNFTVIFTLPSNSDYLLVRSRGSEKFTLNISFHLGASLLNDEIFIPSITPSPENVSNFTSGCWDKNLLRYFICSNDPQAMVSLVYLGSKPFFEEECFANATDTDYYTINLTSAEKMAIVFSTEDCMTLDELVEVDGKQKIPPSIAYLPPPKEERYEVAIYMEYDRIDIANTARLRAGVRNVCISYVGLKKVGKIKMPSMSIKPC